MKSIRSSRLLLIGMVVLLTLMPAGAAQAVPPDQYTYQFTLEASPWIHCGNFWVYEDAVVDVRVREHYDKDGNWVRTEEHITWNGIVYNSRHPDIWLAENTTHHKITYEPSGEFTAVGLVISISLPGEGPIFFGAGRQVWDSDWNLIFWAGLNDWIEDDTDALCAALSL